MLWKLFSRCFLGDRSDGDDRSRFNVASLIGAVVDLLELGLAAILGQVLVELRIN